MLASMRRPKTTQERRNCYIDPEAEFLGIKARAKRRGRNLPDAWDDWFRSDQRSWKKHRRSQFRDGSINKHDRILIIEMKESVVG